MLDVYHFAQFIQLFGCSLGCAALLLPTQGFAPRPRVAERALRP